MKLIFIGSGSAFTVGEDNYQSNMLLESDSKQRLLIDCGSDARWALYELNLSYKDINHVYISHLHADHVGGLEWLGFTRKFDASCDKATIYTAKENLKTLWDKVLSGGLSSMQNVVPTISTFFETVPIGKECAFTWEGTKFQIVKTAHVGENSTTVPSYGLFFNADGHMVFITTDTQFTPHTLDKYYQKADIIFQDCETTTKKTGVHAHYDELKTLDDSVKQKMWLYHYNPGKLPNAKKDGFRGFIKKGQCFDFSDPKTL